MVICYKLSIMVKLLTMLDIQCWRNIVVETGIYIHKFRRQTTNLLHLNAGNSVSETEDQPCYKLTNNTQEMKLELRKRIYIYKWFPPKKFESLGSLPSKNLRAWSLPINIQSQNKCLLAFPSISLFIQQRPNT
jgi:hypothetical protein